MWEKRESLLYHRVYESQPNILIAQVNIDLPHEVLENFSKPLNTGF